MYLLKMPIVPNISIDDTSISIDLRLSDPRSIRICRTSPIPITHSALPLRTVYRNRQVIPPSAEGAYCFTTVRQSLHRVF